MKNTFQSENAGQLYCQNRLDLTAGMIKLYSKDATFKNQIDNFVSIFNDQYGTDFSFDTMVNILRGKYPQNLNYKYVSFVTEFREQFLGKLDTRSILNFCRFQALTSIENNQENKSATEFVRFFQDTIYEILEDIIDRSQSSEASEKENTKNLKSREDMLSLRELIRREDFDAIFSLDEKTFLDTFHTRLNTQEMRIFYTKYIYKYIQPVYKVILRNIDLWHGGLVNKLGLFDVFALLFCKKFPDGNIVPAHRCNIVEFLVGLGQLVPGEHFTKQMWKFARMNEIQQMEAVYNSLQGQMTFSGKCLPAYGEGSNIGIENEEKEGESKQIPIKNSENITENPKKEKQKEKRSKEKNTPTLDKFSTSEDTIAAIVEKRNIIIVPAESMSVDPEKTSFPELLDKANTLIEEGKETLPKKKLSKTKNTKSTSNEIIKNPVKTLEDFLTFDEADVRASLKTQPFSVHQEIIKSYIETYVEPSFNILLEKIGQQYGLLSRKASPIPVFGKYLDSFNKSLVYKKIYLCVSGKLKNKQFLLNFLGEMRTFAKKEIEEKNRILAKYFEGRMVNGGDILLENWYTQERDSGLIVNEESMNELFSLPQEVLKQKLNTLQKSVKREILKFILTHYFEPVALLSKDKIQNYGIPYRGQADAFSIFLRVIGEQDEYARYHKFLKENEYSILFLPLLGKIKKFIESSENERMQQVGDVLVGISLYNKVKLPEKWYLQETIDAFLKDKEQAEKQAKEKKKAKKTSTGKEAPRKKQETPLKNPENSVDQKPTKPTVLPPKKEEEKTSPASKETIQTSALSDKKSKMPESTTKKETSTKSVSQIPQPGARIKIPAKNPIMPTPKTKKPQPKEKVLSRIDENYGERDFQKFFAQSPEKCVKILKDFSQKEITLWGQKLSATYITPSFTRLKDYRENIMLKNSVGQYTLFDFVADVFPNPQDKNQPFIALLQTNIELFIDSYYQDIKKLTQMSREEVSRFCVGRCKNDYKYFADVNKITGAYVSLEPFLSAETVGHFLTKQEPQDFKSIYKLAHWEHRKQYIALFEEQYLQPFAEMYGIKGYGEGLWNAILRSSQSQLTPVADSISRHIYGDGSLQLMAKYGKFLKEIVEEVDAEKKNAPLPKSTKNTEETHTKVKDILVQTPPKNHKQLEEKIEKANRQNQDPVERILSIIEESVSKSQKTKTPKNSEKSKKSAKKKKSLEKSQPDSTIQHILQTYKIDLSSKKLKRQIVFATMKNREAFIKVLFQIYNEIRLAHGKKSIPHIINPTKREEIFTQIFVDKKAITSQFKNFVKNQEKDLQKLDSFLDAIIALLSKDLEKINLNIPEYDEK